MLDNMNAKQIEIIGPSGVGKSTVIKELLKSTNIHSGRRLLYKKGFVNRLLKKCRTFSYEEEQQFNKLYCDVFNCFLSQYPKDDRVGINEYLRKLIWLKDTAYIHFFAEKNYKSKFYIVDESFTHRGLSYLFMGKDFLVEYYDKVPLPSHLFVLKANNEEIFNRKEKKEGKFFLKVTRISSKVNFFEHINEIFILIDFIYRKYIEKGVSVYFIDANRPITEVVNEIKKYLR
jgi:thymidylate kinase